MCSLPNATSAELDEASFEPVVIFMPEIDRENLGGTMRLGSRATHFQPGSEWSKTRSLYETSWACSKSARGTEEPLVIHERHRHRYEVNPEYIAKLNEHGLNFIGKDNKGERMEILELQSHPWFVCVQYHPEYLSRVLAPSKPYLGFLAVSAGCLDEVLSELQSKASWISVTADANGLSSGVNGILI